MATGKSYYTRSNYRFLSGDLSGGVGKTFTAEPTFELNESDIYNSGRSISPEIRRSAVPNSRNTKKRGDYTGDRSRGGTGTPCSLPVNIPDWSKILKEEYREKRSSFEYEDEEEGREEGSEEGGIRIPPHELLARQMARTRIVSFSVHEGIGRTLKGRDLSRVRNAIWEKTGFED